MRVLALALIPAAGNFAGGLLADMTPVSRRTLSLALHAAAGIVIAVVGLEIMPDALDIGPAWVMLLALVGGAGCAILLDMMMAVVRTRTGGTEDTAEQGPWIIYFGVAVDLFSDGVLIGTGSTIDPRLGLILALGQVVADVPEGFATIATFKSKGIARRKRLLLAASFVIPIVLGATLGYWAVRDYSEAIKFALLSFTAGILLTIAVEEMVSEAHKVPDVRVAPLFLVGGFALFGLLTAYLG